MSPSRRDRSEQGVPYDAISRRKLLAAGGVVAVGGLAGCLDRIVGGATNTSASPAAAFAGNAGGWNDDDTEISFVRADGEPHVSRLTPTLSGGSGLLSGDVELEAWVTAVTLEDYNTPRSNRSAANPIDIIDEDDDDVDEDDETVRAVLELEAALQGAANDAILAISKRSARTGRNPETGKEITEALDEMDEALAALRAELERCSDESCVKALENVDEIKAEVSHAREHVAEGQLGEAAEAIGGEGSDILVGDYLVAPGVDPSDEQREALVEYLSGSPMVGERFAVCLPDAEVPGGNGSLAEEVTPQRFIDYMTGRAADDGNVVYAWGRTTKAAADGDDDDEDDTECSEGAGSGSGYELVCGSTHLEANLSGPFDTGGGLRSARADVNVTVVNDPPVAEAGASTLVCPVDGEAYEPSDLSEWGSESGASSETPTVVCQVMVQPPECSVPVRALLYVKRCRSDEQLVYTGGWVLDTAGLFEDAVTMLTLAGETQVVGIECCFDYNGAVSRALSSERARRGAQLESGTSESLVEAGVMSQDGKESYDRVIRKKPGGRMSDGSGGSVRVLVTHCPLDAPVLHLVNAGSASEEVKFKAGAELSKSVN